MLLGKPSQKVETEDLNKWREQLHISKQSISDNAENLKIMDHHLSRGPNNQDKTDGEARKDQVDHVSGHVDEILEDVALFEKEVENTTA